MTEIKSIQARWILDSRGFPTLQVKAIINQQGKEAIGIAGVPSGASTGSYEALELRDQDKSKFHGKGVDTAVKNVNQEIATVLIGKSFANATDVDQFVLDLDGTENKTRFGANSVLGVSMAVHRAFANLHNLELWQYLRRLYFSSLPKEQGFPRLMCNVINGGQHADNPLDIQEFMIVPKTGELETDIRAASEIYHTLKKNLKKDNQSTALGDEGGFAPNIESTQKVLQYLEKAITDSGYSLDNCDLALDAAASEFFKENKYKIEGRDLSSEELVSFYEELLNKYNIISIEDGFHEDDVKGWQMSTQAIGQKSLLIGDDYFVTNPKRFQEYGLNKKAANGILIKLNQIGSVLETAKMINLAKENNYVTIISHRSGETTDSFISDLAVASQSEFIKLGAPARGERVAKFNRLLEIFDGINS
jgi:enolase